MLIRLERSFVETLSQLNESFSDSEKQALAESIESKYYDISSIIKDLEIKKLESEPRIIELDNMGFQSFNLNLYYRVTEEDEDVPISIVQMLPTISHIRIDIMAKLQNSNQKNSSYLKAGTVYDNGDIHAKYLNEVIDEDRGFRPVE